MLVYIAGSTRDIDRVHTVQNHVRGAGHLITFDWTGVEGEIRTDGSWDTVPEKGAEIASREIEACTTADLTIVLFPRTRGGLGCWIEMGAALAGDGDVWVVAPQRDSVFWQHAKVTRFDTDEDACRAIHAGTKIPEPPVVAL